jgi:hypothetical protein
MDDGSQYRIASTTLLGIGEERSKRVLMGTGLEPGSIFDPSAVERFFAAHRDLVGDLPTYAVSEIQQNESNKTVILIFDLRRCGE